MSQPPGRDLLHTKEIKALVRDTYHAVASPTGAVARRLYSAEELAQISQIAIDGALGVASPVRHADIEPGNTVLDLGCGYGIDTILAARRTGPGGRVIALDFLPAMLDRTAEAAAQAGLLNVDTLHADIEDIPLPDRTWRNTSPGKVLSRGWRGASSLTSSKMSASRASPSSRTRRATAVSSGAGRFLAGIHRR